MMRDRSRAVLVMVAAFFLAAGGGTAEAAETAGKVLSVKGIMSAERADGSLAVLGAGDPVFTGDTLSTGERGFGIIELTDGSRMTLRPGTRFALDEYVTAPEKPSIGTRLMRGGIRAITGWIPKKNTGSGFRIQTQTAVMGIRGTEFDARLCQGDCSGEGAPQPAQAAPVLASAAVGRVVSVVGRLTALTPDGKARGLLQGAAVLQEDFLETGSGSHALIAFRDGTRVTLQADAAFLVENYRHGAGEGETPSAFFRLMRGGMRILTGSIAKQRPDRFKVAAPTAVAGVRGTGFDMTLCEAPCRQNDAPPQTVVARVFSTSGPLTAEHPGKPVRTLVAGGDVLEGDILQTGQGGVAVVVFRDDTRVALQPGSRFSVSRYRYVGADVESGVFRLYRGGVRMVTGWLAKRTRSYTVETATAVVGVRGTGFDLMCTGACARQTPPAAGSGDAGGLVARVWDGTIAISNEGGETLVGAGTIVRVTSLQALPVVLPQAPAILDALPAPRPDRLNVDLKSLFSAVAPGTSPPAVIVNTWEGEVALRTESGQSVIIQPGDTILYAGGAAIPVRMAAPPVFMQQAPGPRPDQVPVDMDQLFRQSEHSGKDPGLYVTVYDGDVVISNDDGEIHLGKGESGFAGLEPGQPIRLAVQPLFLILDPVPSPAPGEGAPDGTVNLLFEDFGGEDSRKEPECEIR